MTPAEIKKTRLYRNLAPCVRKEDREELARMLAMVSPEPHMDGFDASSIWNAFVWNDTPQGGLYWGQLYGALHEAGHEADGHPY